MRRILKIREVSLYFLYFLLVLIKPLCKRWQILFLSVCLSVSNSCSHISYSPDIVAFPSETLITSSAVEPIYQANLYVGDFDSSSFDKVDVSNNLTMDVDCSKFGIYLRETIIERLSHEKGFKKIVSNPLDANLILKGSIKDIKIINNYGSGTSTSGKLYAEILKFPGKEVFWSTTLRANGFARGRLDVNAALDQLRGALTDSLLKQLLLLSKKELADKMRNSDLESQYASETKESTPVSPYIPKSTSKEITAENIREIPKFNGSQRQNDLAVVIGIENYKGLPKSDYSKSDAGLVKDYLKALGFRDRNIEFITDGDATKSAIEKSIEAWLPNRVKKDSKVFVYYSGHGAPEPKTGDAYIVPFDGDPNYLEVTGYSLKRLYDKLGKLQAAEVVVLLDSCFSGAGGRSVLAKGARPLVMMTDIKSIPSNMAILSATQGTQISTSSTEKGHGVFTYYFLKALKYGKKTIAEIYEYIKPLVEDEAKTLNVQQSPSISPDAEKLKGRFILRR